MLAREQIPTKLKKIALSISLCFSVYAVWIILDPPRAVEAANLLLILRE